MKQIAIILLLLLSKFSFGSPQSPDLLLIGQDTIYIYHLPIGHLTEERQKLLYDNISTLITEFGIGLNLWRGYQGVWRLENDSLFLVDFNNLDNAQEIMKKSFPELYDNEKVFAKWFSSNLTIPKGKILKWDGVFGRTYFKEEILKFKKGKLVKKKLVDNYIDKEKGISRLSQKEVSDSIFSAINKLNWVKLGDKFCDDEYFVVIGSNGKIKSVKLVPIMDTKWENFYYSVINLRCRHKISRSLRKLRFDIIKWNGKPWEETYWIEVFYDDESKKLENWSEYEDEN